jgi:hypothetical protein
MLFGYRKCRVTYCGYGKNVGTEKVLGRCVEVVDAVQVLFVVVWTILTCSGTLSQSVLGRH